MSRIRNVNIFQSPYTILCSICTRIRWKVNIETFADIVYQRREKQLTLLYCRAPFVGRWLHICFFVKSNLKKSVDIINCKVEGKGISRPLCTVAFPVVNRKQHRIFCCFLLVLKSTTFYCKFLFLFVFLFVTTLSIIILWMVLSSQQLFICRWYFYLTVISYYYSNGTPAISFFWDGTSIKIVIIA